MRAAPTVETAIESIEIYLQPRQIELLAVAKSVIAFLKRHADGEPLNKFDTLLTIARKLLCKVVVGPHGGSYATVTHPEYLGVIRISWCAEGEADLTRDLGHELTHHVIWVYGDRVLGDYYNEHGDLLDDEETICKIVAEMIQPVPADMEWRRPIIFPTSPSMEKLCPDL